MYWRIIVICVFAFMATFIGNNFSYAWSVLTHRLLSANAVTTSDLNSILPNIGLTSDAYMKGKDYNGVEKSQNIVKWIEDGAEFEDSGNIFNGRYYNHFHNPLKQSWDQAGLNDWLLFLPVSGDSALLWAQDSVNNPDWSWKAGRNNYYNALTATTDTSRQYHFARTFEGLGNTIHLIQDMAQPAHVRNDAHPLDGIGLIPGLEHWAALPQNKSKIDGFASNPVFPSLPLTSSVNGLTPITEFWDTDRYDGTEATLSLTISTNVGLSEYTNANFFSDDTIDSIFSWHRFPYPSNNPANYYTCPDIAPADSYVSQRLYLSRTPCDQGPIDHFLTIGVLTDFDETDPINPQLALDDRVHEDYAKQLIPRAVGYSSGLLNYFFRGQMEIICMPAGLKVKNIGNEIMTTYTDPNSGDIIGSIAIYYDDNNEPSQRKILAEYQLAAPLAPGAQTDEITFTKPSDNIKSGRYIIVFHGKLGAEEGAVIGMVKEPMPIYYASKRNGIYKIYKTDPCGDNETLVYDNPNPDINIGKLAPSPDGKALAFTVQGSRIYLLDLTTGALKELTTGEWPTWSPDGTKIAFQRETGQYLPTQADVEIFTIDPATLRETNLTNVEGSSYSGQPAWSPDGNTIAYLKWNQSQNADCKNYYTIDLIDSNGTPKGPVTCSNEQPYLDFAPSWSPDGKEIAFTRRRENQLNQLHKVNIETKTVTKLTESTGSNYNELTPAWSTDGKSIAVGSNIDGDFDIWLIDPNGGSGSYITNLTDSNTDIDGYPAFGN